MANRSTRVKKAVSAMTSRACEGGVARALHQSVRTDVIHRHSPVLLAPRGGGAPCRIGLVRRASPGAAQAYMPCSLGSAARSAETSVAGSLLLFFHQCDRPPRIDRKVAGGGTVEIGTEQWLEYSVMVPEMM